MSCCLSVSYSVVVILVLALVSQDKYLATEQPKAENYQGAEKRRHLT